MELLSAGGWSSVSKDTFRSFGELGLIQWNVDNLEKIGITCHPSHHHPR
jgi:hypothetical protein